MRQLWTGTCNYPFKTNTHLSLSVRPFVCLHLRSRGRREVARIASQQTAILMSGHVIFEIPGCKADEGTLGAAVAYCLSVLTVNMDCKHTVTQ